MSGCSRRPPIKQVLLRNQIKFSARPALSIQRIKSAIAESLPLIKECYQLALHENSTLAGTIKVKFTIAAEPEVGGAVELVDIEGKDRAARQPTLSECIRETIYSLEFPEPKGGGVVNVTYPFTFRTTTRNNPK